MTDPTKDPFMPQVPERYEYGRLFTHRALAAGWPCRVCLTLLPATPSGALVCIACDLNISEPPYA